ncbi:MAG TPA: NUDIX hydrolase [Acidimicrobiales bacterium]|nr:NUDIX hydrolase [Acidimicrobiales bacterium]
MTPAPSDSWTSGPGAPGERRVHLAAFVLPVHEGRVLLARHSYGPALWAMVGGAVQEDESVEAAARREVLEETGLGVETDRMVGFADRSDLSLYVFSGRVVEGLPDSPTPQAGEIQELRWFTAEELAGATDVFEMARLLGAGLLAVGAGGGGWTRRELTWPSGEVVPVYLDLGGSGPATAAAT